MRIFCVTCMVVFGIGVSLQSVVTRGCFPSLEFDNQCDESTLYGVKVQTCTCNSNLCNSILPVRGSFIALVASNAIYRTLF